MSLRSLLIVAMTALLAATPVTAAKLDVVVRDANGLVVKDAVVTFTPANGAGLTADDRKGPFIMAQKGVQFAPRVLIVPLGATVSFPNLDRVNHHVYSFSQTKVFQLPLYGFHQSRNVVFDKAGTVALGCNIHDQMGAFIRVVATPYYGRTDDKGAASLANLPQGKGTVSVWHPSIIGAEVTQNVDATTSQSLNLNVKLRAAS